MSSSIIKDIEGTPLPFLSNIIHFPTENLSFELLKPVTNFKSCHDGTPSEARVVFTCRKVQSGTTSVAGSESEGKQDDGAEEFIMKIKVQ